MELQICWNFVAQMALVFFNSKIEDAFYNNKLRLNGQKLVKKSKTVSGVPLHVTYSFP